MTYKNPIIPGFYPDPSVCKVNDDYYLVTSSFEYFPGIPIFHSKDLIHWQQIGHVLDRESQLPLTRNHAYIPSQGIYAPTIRYHEGKFYVITTNITTLQTFYVWTEDPNGLWSEPIVVEGWSGIDPSLYFSSEGKVYITGASFPTAVPEGIYQAEIDIQSGKLLTNPQFVWAGSGGSSPEAPHLFEKDGLFYLLIAEGGTEYGHMVTIARSTSAFGPFENNPANPIMSNRSTNQELQGIGHADFVQGMEKNSWWAVLLGFRTLPGTKLHTLGRETNLVAIEWNEDGWPTIGQEGQVTIENDSRELPVKNSVRWQSYDNFDSKQLACEWNFYRNPVSEAWSLTEKKGTLTLYGQANTLSENGSPAFVGRRQQHMTCNIEAELAFTPTREGEEAGISVFMNENYHYDLAKIFKNGQSKVVFRRKVGSLLQEVEEVYSGDQTIILQIQATPFQYLLSFKDENGEAVDMGSGEAAFLSSEVAGGFTGVYFALYATGNGQLAENPAYFNRFSYALSKD